GRICFPKSEVCPRDAMVWQTCFLQQQRFAAARVCNCSIPRCKCKEIPCVVCLRHRGYSTSDELLCMRTITLMYRELRVPSDKWANSPWLRRSKSKFEYFSGLCLFEQL